MGGGAVMMGKMRVLMRWFNLYRPRTFLILMKYNFGNLPVHNMMRFKCKWHRGSTVKDSSLGP